MHLLGNDPLHRKLDSYSVISEDIEPEDLEKPF
jgi:hypothetical protein